MLEDIHYKLTLDKEGNLEFVELWQGYNHINLSFAGEGSHKNYSRWDVVKGVVDKLQAEQHDRVGYLARGGDDANIHD